MVDWDSAWKRALPGLRSAAMAETGLAPSLQEIYLLCRLHCHGLRGFLLLLPVTDRGPDCILGQHRAVNFHRRQGQFLHDLRVLDRKGLVDRLALDPFGRKRRGRDRPTATKGLELL